MILTGTRSEAEGCDSGLSTATACATFLGMKTWQREITLQTSGKGTYEFTAQCVDAVRSAGIDTGMLHAFCRHTSCSLVLMENADPSARRDLERWLDRLVPEGDSDFLHTAEGPDDMPSHIKMALTRSSENIPIGEGRLLTGTWQGIFLWEHRAQPHRRRIVLTIQGS